MAARFFQAIWGFFTAAWMIFVIFGTLLVFYVSVRVFLIVLGMIYDDVSGVKDPEPHYFGAPHSSDQCRPVFGVVGVEDAVWDEATGQVFLSVYDREQNLPRATRDGIYRLDLNDPNPKLRKVAPAAPAAVRDFHPRGIALHREGAEARLFAVSHPILSGGGPRVEVFRVDSAGALQHEKTIRSPLFVSPSDIAAIDRERFYLTNDGWRGSRFAVSRFLEIFLTLPIADLVYFDGEEGRVIERFLFNAMGVHLSHDGRTLYVAQNTRLNLLVYQRDARDDSLTFKETIPLGAAPDKISLDAEGRLYAPAHADIFTSMLLGGAMGRETQYRTSDPDALVPARVFRLSPPFEVIEEIYYRDHRWRAPLTVAAVYGDVMLLGSALEDHILLCRMGGS